MKKNVIQNVNAITIVIWRKKLIMIVMKKEGGLENNVWSKEKNLDNANSNKF